MAARARTGLAASGTSTQRFDSRCSRARQRSGVRCTVLRFQIRPVTSPRHAPLSPSTAIIVCASRPSALPWPHWPSPRRRLGLVAKCTSVVSWMARTWRPTTALAGAFAPAVDDLFRRHLLIGEEPPNPQAAFACLVETPVADRLGRQHLSKDDT